MAKPSATTDALNQTLTTHMQEAAASMWDFSETVAVDDEGRMRTNSTFILCGFWLGLQLAQQHPKQAAAITGAASSAAFDLLDTASTLAETLAVELERVLQEVK